MVSADLLRRIRNDLPMRVAIVALGRDGPPSKMRDGRFVFLCPKCDEMLATVNPRNNLAHCFGCGKNFNNIDLLLALDFDFRSAVTRLERMLCEHLSRRSKRSTTEVK
ncbi:MAG: CHC2 zinc finger domain-containing protein [Gemmataceae bacterium]